MPVAASSAQSKSASVPRDVRLVVRDGEQVVGVESVHAFVQAHVFWWLVSILWCLSLAESVDALLPDPVYAFRFHSSFLDDPTTSGRMFRNQTQAHKRWKSFPARVAKEYPDQPIATLSLDVRSFYYSVDAYHRGSAYVLRPPRTTAAEETSLAGFTELLDALHQRYAELRQEVQPRRKELGDEGTAPLPVGPPSSQVIANLIISMAISDVEELPTTLAVASYVDDLIVMSMALPEFEESKNTYFARLRLADAKEPFSIPSKSTATLHA